MDNEMIARVSRAILECPNASDYETLVAIRAIQAMREPTDYMYEYLASKNIMYKDNSSYGIWTTYIDAIIGE